MRISVRSHCHASRTVPCSFCLGQARHPVVAVLEREIDGETHRFQVRVLDGRRFVLCLSPAADRWELGAVYPALYRRARRAIAPVRPPLASRSNLLLPLLQRSCATLKRLWHHRPRHARLPRNSVPGT